MIKIDTSSRFKKDLNLMLKRGKSSYKFKSILDLLLDNIKSNISHSVLLPKKYKLHKLSGQYTGLWDCHIEPDWILIYYLDDKVLRLERTGTHSDLFK